MHNDLIQVKKIDDNWFTTGTSMVIFDRQIKLRDGAILFARNYNSRDFVFWTFRSSVDEYDFSI